MDAINAPGLNRIHEYTIQQIIVAIVISLVIYVFVQYSPIAAIQLPKAGNTENQPCQVNKGVIDVTIKKKNNQATLVAHFLYPL